MSPTSRIYYTSCPIDREAHSYAEQGFHQLNQGMTLPGGNIACSFQICFEKLQSGFRQPSLAFSLHQKVTWLHSKHAVTWEGFAFVLTLFSLQITAFPREKCWLYMPLVSIFSEYDFPFFKKEVLHLNSNKLQTDCISILCKIFSHHASCYLSFLTIQEFAFSLGSCAFCFIYFK